MLRSEEEKQKSKRIAKALGGVIGWCLVMIGAYKYGDVGLFLIAIGLPLMVHNWEKDS